MEKALEMVDIRNQTTNTYQDLFAQQISEKIPELCDLMDHFLCQLSPNA